MKEIPLLFGLIISFLFFYISGKNFIKKRKNYDWMLPNLKGENAVIQGYASLAIAVIIFIVFLIRIYSIL